MDDTPAPPCVGHDLVHVPRFARALRRREDGWRRRVFTEAEWEYTAARADRDAALAARFAAKEAVMKALGTGWGRGMAWRDVEVRGGGREAPRLVLHGLAADLAERHGLAIRVSLSHAGDTASAVALAWPKSTRPPPSAFP